MKHKDQRISLTNDIIYGIRQIKFLNWEKIFYDKILGIRKSEF